MASRVDLINDAAIEQYADWSLELKGLQIDLAGAIVLAQIRPSYSSPVAVTIAATVTKATIPSSIQLALTSAQTATMQPQSHVWDCIVSVNGTMTRLCEGIAVVTPGVSRAT